MQKIIPVMWLALLVSGIVVACSQPTVKPAVAVKPGAKQASGMDEATVAIRLADKARQINHWEDRFKYNQQVAFLIDLKMPSGKARFFVYDLQHQSVLNSGLVTHGSGSTNGGDSLYFSNVSGSNCSSVGKYRIGNSYQGSFGLAYKLYGLDATNSNAFNRFVVLHSHACVPAVEVFPRQICESWGCPTVSPTYLATLSTYIAASKKPILLWIYY